MIISFFENFPLRLKFGVTAKDKVPTNFIHKIGTGEKIHTIRDDARPWGNGYKIDFYTGSYKAKQRIKHFEKPCVSVQDIEIDFSKKTECVKIDGYFLNDDEITDLLINDGFSPRNINDSTFKLPYKLVLSDKELTIARQRFTKWFEKPFKGKIIHWTNLAYKPISSKEPFVHCPHCQGQGCPTCSGVGHLNWLYNK